MTVKIVSEQEVREALTRNGSANASREAALIELDELRDVVQRIGEYVHPSVYTTNENDAGGDVFLDPRYALELIETIKHFIGDWPLAVTADEIAKGESKCPTTPCSS